MMCVFPGLKNFTTGFCGFRVAQSLVICLVFCRSVCFCFFWSLYCLFFFDWQLLITPLLSSSYVPYVASFSGFSIFDCPFGILWRLFVLCLVNPMLPVSLDCPYLIAPVGILWRLFKCIMILLLLTNDKTFYFI